MWVASTLILLSRFSPTSTPTPLILDGWSRWWRWSQWSSVFRQMCLSEYRSDQRQRQRSSLFIGDCVGGCESIYVFPVRNVNTSRSSGVVALFFGLVPRYMYVHSLLVRHVPVYSTATTRILHLHDSPLRVLLHTRICVVLHVRVCVRCVPLPRSQKRQRSSWLHRPLSFPLSLSTCRTADFSVTGGSSKR